MEDDYSSYSLLRSYDLIWVPICFLLLYIIVYNKRKKYKGTEIYRYYMPAFLWRIFFAIVYTLVSEYYFIFADTNHYYQAVLDMHRAVKDNFDYLGDIYFKLKLRSDNRIFNYFLYDRLGITQLYMYDPKNYFVPRFALPFSLLFNKSYMAISFCMSFFAFGGCWRLFKMFYHMYPHLHKKLAIAILFMPSVLFWGVGLMKDTICLGALGFFLYGAYNVFIRQYKRGVSSILMIATGYLIFYIKPYILICVMPAFVLWLFLRWRVLIKDKTLRQISTVLLAAVSVVAAFILVQNVTSSELAQQYSTEKLVKTVQNQQNVFQENVTQGGGSNFSVSKVDNSTGGLLTLFPVGIMNTFFRPFPWDVKSPFMAFSFLEAAAFIGLIYLCFRRIGFRKTFSYMGSDPAIIFCIVFALMFGGFIGLSTTNFGALVRYKIPCLAFFAIAFIVVMDKSGKFSPNYFFSKKFF